MQALTQEAQFVSDYVIGQRRWFHQNPELSKAEFHTTSHILEELSQLDIPVQCFDGLTGCVGVLKGARPGPTVMLRADIDALPIQEQSSVPYASHNPGVMHACGHDCHAAMLLGAAKILKARQSELAGTVKFLFQMGEEVGVESRKYVQVGVLDDVNALFGMHVWASLDAGTANFQAGERMASSDRFTIDITGKSAPAAQPQTGSDAILAAAAVTTALQSIAAKLNAPQNTLVVTVGMFNGGQAPDVLCDKVQLVGTARTFNKEFRKSIPEMIKKIAANTALCYGCTADVTYNFFPSPVINEDESLVALAQQAATAQLGADSLVPMEKAMTAEDFSELAEKAPSVFGFLGIRNEEKGMVCCHHHPGFCVDEEVLPRGAGIYADFAKEFLNCRP